jgi:hypothetical protein
LERPFPFCRTAILVALQRHRYALIIGNDRDPDELASRSRELLCAVVSCCVMDGVEHLREDLAFVDRMIAECQYHITRLQKTTTEMSRDGQDTDLANDVLANFTAALTRHEAERKRVVSAIAGDKSVAGLVADLDRSRPSSANLPRRKAPRRANAPATARRRRKSLAK